MLFGSIFGKRLVCGVDSSVSGGRVCVVGLWDKGKLVFSKGSEIPSTHDVACAVPARLSLVRRLDSPFSSKRKTRRVLPSLLDVQMPFSLEECCVAFTHLTSKPDGKVSAMAAAARTSDLAGFLNELKGTGVDPLYVDAEGIALWAGSVAEIPPGADESRRAILKIEAGTSTLALGEGTSLLASHALSDLGPARVRRLLIAAYGSEGAVNWYICGGECSSDQLAGLLDALGGDWVGSSTVHADPEALLARSLVRRAAEPSREGVNLRRGVLQHDALSIRESGGVRSAAALLVACGLSLGALSFGSNEILARKIRNQEADFLRKAAELSGGDLGGAAGIHALQRVEKAVARKVDAAQPFLAPFEKPPQYILREIARHAAESEVLIERIEISSKEINIEGTGATWRTPERLVTFLKGKGMSVVLDREESLASEAVRYSVSAKGKGVWE